MHIKILKFSLLILFSLINFNIFSQELLNSKNISQIKVESLSDAEILKFQQQLKATGLSIEDAEKLALSKGMPPMEVAKLKVRLENMNTGIGNSNSNNVTNSPIIRSYVPINDQTSVSDKSINNKIFGSELFATNSLSFEPNLQLATPLNYILGPGDAILINLYGLQEVSFSQTVSPEGTIYISSVGLIKVAGFSIEQATALIKSRMSQIGYKSLRGGSTKLSISLIKIRSIHITILGAVKSGSYTISSLSTLFNALYISGGPSQNRSFRTIELIRDNKLYKYIDLYKFLLTGDESDNVSLKDNDIIRLPVYEKRVEIEGEVKRPGIFELLPNENLSDLLKYTSGFSDSAFRESIKVIQLTKKEKRVKDINEDAFSLYIPNSGDYFDISKILDRFENRVTISGAVFRPGTFEITPNLTIGKLIKRADGLKEDAFTKRGQLFRLKEDNSTEIISFDVVKAMTGGTDDLKLQREDSVIISSLFDLKDSYNISIQGEVRKPGSFPFNDGITLKDLILQAGGFTYAAYPQRIEIARLIKRDTLISSDSRLSEIINVQNLNDLSLNNKNIDLQPYDIITVRRMPGYLQLESVIISGQVQFPGSYVLSNRSEKASDLLKRAGGFSPEAYPNGAYLKRNNIKVQNNLKVSTIQKQLKDSSVDIIRSVERPFDLIPIDLNNILANNNSENNLILKPGDELFIPRNDQEIKISGEVYFPTQSPFKVKKSLKDYVNDAGGFTESARKKKVYILYNNGKAVASKYFLFFHKYPIVNPGAEIIVPRNIQKRKLSTAETIGITSAMASLAGIVIAIIQLTKK